MDKMVMFWLLFFKRVIFNIQFYSFVLDGESGSQNRKFIRMWKILNLAIFWKHYILEVCNWLLFYLSLFMVFVLALPCGTFFLQQG